METKLRTAQKQVMLLKGPESRVGKAKQAYEHGDIESWNENRARELWKLILSITDPGNTKPTSLTLENAPIMCEEFLRKVDRGDNFSLAKYLLDNSKNLKTIISQRQKKHVMGLLRSEKHQARSLMAVLATRLGEVKIATLNQILHMDLAVDPTKANRLKPVPLCHLVPGVGELACDKRLLSRTYHRAITKKK